MRRSGEACDCQHPRGSRLVRALGAAAKVDRDDTAGARGADLSLEFGGVAEPSTI